MGATEGFVMRPAFLLALALAVAFSSPAWAVDSDGTRPDDKLTPGEVRTVSREEICTTKTGTVRNVSVTTKIAVKRAYGLINRPGWCPATEVCTLEIDHRVPLEIGGGNTPGSIRNLWPERGEGPNNFHDKDRCENETHRRVCAGTLSVEAAQAIFLGDWVAGCATLMGTK
jgi:hypothetical protein